MTLIVLTCIMELIQVKEQNYFLVQIRIFFSFFFFIVSFSYTPFSPNLYVPGLWENKGKLLRGVLPDLSARH